MTFEEELDFFVRESNRIEGILREPTAAEVEAHRVFLGSWGGVPDLEKFVAVIQPDAELRRRRGLNVLVGRHVPPPGGPEIEVALQRILHQEGIALGPYWQHQLYEALHPFTDGNGRSGRVLWLKHYGRAPCGFLHEWYYQSLRGKRSDVGLAPSPAIWSLLAEARVLSPSQRSRV